MYKFFVSLVISCFFSTAVLGMTEQKDVSGNTSLETGMSQLSLCSAAGVKTGGDKKDQDKTEYVTYWGDTPEVWLDTATKLVLPDKETYWDHAKLRFFMRGDQKKYIALFKRAVEEKNAVLQVALTNACRAAVWDGDARKDFSVFDPKNFKTFIFSLHEHLAYCVLYREAFESSAPDLIERGEIAEKVYKQAAVEGFEPAILKQIMLYGSRCEHTDNYEHMHRSNLEILSKLAASGNPEAKLLYGRMLFWDYESKNPEERCKWLQSMYKFEFSDVECKPIPEKDLYFESCKATVSKVWAANIAELVSKL